MIDEMEEGERYQYNPYCVSNPRLRCVPTPPPGTILSAIASCGPPVLFHELQGRVTFVPFPREAVRVQTLAGIAKDDLQRIFIGQLPYDVTDMELFWICSEFGDGAQIFGTQRIMKKARNGKRVPSGCVHAFVDPREVETLITRLNRRVLFDEGGVWHATTDAELEVLDSFCRMLVMERQRRRVNTPHQAISVQIATTTFVREMHDPFWGESNKDSASSINDGSSSRDGYLTPSVASDLADDFERLLADPFADFHTAGGSDEFPLDFRDTLLRMFKEDPQRAASEFLDGLRKLFKEPSQEGKSNNNNTNNVPFEQYRDAFRKLFHERRSGGAGGRGGAETGALEPPPDCHHTFHRMFKETDPSSPMRDVAESFAALFQAGVPATASPQ